MSAIPTPAAVGDMAGLVVMGGPMGVSDDLGWLEDERELLREAVAKPGCPYSACASARSSWPLRSAPR